MLACEACRLSSSLRTNHFRTGRRTCRYFRLHCQLNDFGGANKGNLSQSGRIIIPGQGMTGRDNQGTGPSSAPKLILPGEGKGASTGNLAESGEQTAYRNFRPPPGFMDAEVNESEDVDISPEVMLKRIQAQAGPWHELAKLLPILQSKGFDANVVEEATGLEKRMQNIWTSSASIYTALKKSGKVPEPVLKHFDSVGGEILLHELKFLSLQQRVSAVEFIAKNDLDPTETQKLARAIKEHERRSGQKEGFAQTPADCLAFKFYRDALECRLPADAKECALKGLDLVESEVGKSKLEAILGTTNSRQEDTSPKATLDVLRLQDNEVGWRSIPLLGELDATPADVLRNAPKSSSEGIFGIFTLPEDGLKHRWVALPAWAALMMAVTPAALYIRNCADFSPLISKLGDQGDGAVQKAQGEGILMIDVKQPVETDVESYYAIEDDKGIVQIVGGEDIEDKNKIVGVVMFLCRPPRKASDAATTSNLLSV